MNNLFNYGQSVKKLADIATEHVRVYRQARQSALESLKKALISSSSPIQLMIIETAKNGQLQVNIDFHKLAKEHKLSFGDYLFSDNEIDQLIIFVVDFLEKEGFSHTVNGHIITVTWTDPQMVDYSDDDRQDLKFLEYEDEIKS